MKKILFIDCCIRREDSRTKKLADHVLRRLRQKNGYEIQELCLMDENLSYFSDGFFFQRERLLAEKNYDHPRFRYANQFAEADKIIIAAPFWDLSFPALLKVYIENLCVEGITFGCDETGMFGTCKADHMVFLTTRGASYPKGDPMEMGSPYLEAMCRFFGIDRYDCVAADGLDLGLRPVNDIMREAMEEADHVLETL